MLEKIAKFREYLDYIEEHYNNVQGAWKIISEKCSDMRFVWDDYFYHSIESEVIRHDESKLSVEEFTQYRQYFFPVKGEKKNIKAFDLAWEHHKKVNNHHWEHWTNHDNHYHYDEICVVLMLIDWYAMSIKFGDTPQEYYERNKDDISIPKWAEDFLYEIFLRLKLIS